MAIDLERPWRVGPPGRAAAGAVRRAGLPLRHAPAVLPQDRKLLAVVQALGEQPSGRDACRAAGVADAELPAYERALATLAEHRDDRGGAT